jgi:hypothetical protein
VLSRTSRQWITYARGAILQPAEIQSGLRLSRTKLHSTSLRNKTRSHPSGSQLPPAFWDNLSKIDLTKRALEELDRRNTQAALSSRPPYPRPITRRVLAELKKSSQPLTPTIKYLCHRGTRVLKNIKQTARHGGPDLSDLRGVRGRHIRCSQCWPISSFQSLQILKVQR